MANHNVFPDPAAAYGKASTYKVANPLGTHDFDFRDLRCRVCNKAEVALAMSGEPCLGYCLWCNHKATDVPPVGTICDNCDMSDIDMI